MRVLIIGFGSIGRRHAEVLKALDPDSEIHIVTRQSIDTHDSFPALNEIAALDCYDYFVIASETHLHHEHLAYLDAQVKNKLICCEKPLFHKVIDFEPQHNQVFIGYCLRFHPVIRKLRELLQDELPIYVQIVCGSYLPSWRPGSDYSKSYSARKESGGGVLLDLSHEIDYAQWLFGNLTAVQSLQATVSDLAITSDDLTTFVGKTESGIMLNVSLDYFSKVPTRTLRVHTNKQTFIADLVGNSLTAYTGDGVPETYAMPPITRNHIYEHMHQAILNRYADACSYTDGMQTLRAIATIEKQNHG